MKVNIHLYNVLSGLVPARLGWSLRRILAGFGGASINGSVKLNIGVYFSHSNVLSGVLLG